MASWKRRMESSSSRKRPVGDCRIEVGRNRAGKEAEDLAPAFVSPEIPRHCVEAVLVESLQKRPHEVRVLAGRTAHRFAYADYALGDTTSSEWAFLHLVRP